MSDDTLEALSDEELNEAFVVEIAGWRRSRIRRDRWIEPGETMDPPIVWHASPPQYCTADAVLPLLAKCHTWQSLFDQGEMREYTVEVWAPYYAEAEADTFPRAACLALLKAKRAQKETT